MDRRTILAGAAAIALLVAGAAWKMGLFNTVSDVGNCADVIALIATAPDRAAAVCKRQANEGDAIAQTDLGKMYAEGRGVEQDFGEARRWFEKAIAQKQPDAYYNLGLMYANGEGVTQDFAEAAKWYRIAADLGQSDAQNSLGLRYKRGEGVGQDYVQAHKWFALSAAYAAHPADRARAIANRDAVAKLMTTEQLVEAQKLTREWKPTGP